MVVCLGLNGTGQPMLVLCETILDSGTKVPRYADYSINATILELTLESSSNKLNSRWII